MSCAVLAQLFVGPDRAGIGLATANEVYAENLEWLTRAGIFAKLIPRLCDTSPTVRIHAYGAVNNMAIVGGKQVCDALIAGDVLSVLEASLKKHIASGMLTKRVSPDIPREASAVIKREKMSVQQIFSILIVLCEHNETAVRRLSAKLLIDHVLICLRSGVTTEGLSRGNGSIAECAARLLHVLSDSNAAMMAYIDAHPLVLENLTTIVKSDPETTTPSARGVSLRTRLHVAGLMTNAVGRIKSMSPSIVFEKITPLIVSVLEFKSAAVLKRVIEEVASTSSSPRPPRARSEWSEIADCQVLALEIVANIFSLDDEDEDDGTCDDVLTISPVFQRQLVQRVIGIVRALGAGDSWSRLASQFVTDAHCLRHRALSCLSNMVQNVRDGMLVSDMQGLGDFLFELLMACSSERSAFSSYVPVSERSDVVCSKLLWTYLRRGDATKMVHLTDKQLGALESTLTSDTIPIRLHVTGILSSLAARTSPSSNKRFVAYLATLHGKALRDADLLVVSEALNGVFDLFGEKDHNDVFAKLGVLSTLEELLSSMSSKFRSEKGALSELVYMRIDEALENLERFVAYKKGEGH